MMDNKAPTMPMMAIQYSKAFSLVCVANGTSHAFKPKDFTPRVHCASNTNSESPEEIKAKSTGCRKPFHTWRFESSLLFCLLEQSFDASLSHKKAIARRSWITTWHVRCFKPKDGFTPRQKFPLRSAQIQRASRQKSTSCHKL